MPYQYKLVLINSARRSLEVKLTVRHLISKEIKRYIDDNNIVEDKNIEEGGDYYSDSDEDCYDEYYGYKSEESDGDEENNKDKESIDKQPSSSTTL